jgi:hypothetical protein
MIGVLGGPPSGYRERVPWAVTHILQKLDPRDRVQAVVLAYQTGIFEQDELQSRGHDESGVPGA